MTAFDAAYRHAKDVATWAMGHVQGLPLAPTPRNRLAGAAYGLALEHHRAMTVLVEAMAYGSALTLIRPAVEGFARGYWLLYRANDAQLREFVVGRHSPPLDRLLREIANEGAPGPQIGELQQLVQRLNALTHGAIEHLALRQSSSSVGPRYRAEDMAQGLDVATWVAKMAALDMVGGVADDAERATRMQQELEAQDQVRGPLIASRASAPE